MLMRTREEILSDKGNAFALLLEVMLDIRDQNVEGLEVYHQVAAAQILESEAIVVQVANERDAILKSSSVAP